MKIRTECPKNNKYYIRIATGGYNGAVAGYPMQKYADVLDNCVGGANGRFNEIINDPELKGIEKPFKYQLVCDAEDFIESAKRQGLKISPTPVEGGIMVWRKGATLSPSDGAGHVAVVERVYDDGSILTSESGWASWAWKTVRRDNKNGRWGQNENYTFRGCVTNPSIKNPKVVPVPPLTVDGVGGSCTIRAMQRLFGTPQDGVLSGQNRSLKKYYPSIKAVEYDGNGSACVKKLQKWVGVTQDGILGEKTVKAWQKKLGVTADGIFGTESMKAWQRYLNKKLFKDDSKSDSDGTSKASVYKVIDVSDWQGKIDWKKVKADGVVGAIIRYADGDVLDKRFTENMKNAKNAGLHIGCYIFSRAKTKAEAEKEAERLFKASKPYSPDMPLYIDLEVSSLSKYANTVAQAFLKKMESLGGRGGVYANLNWWNNYLVDTAKNYSEFAFWIAQYNDKMTHKTPNLFGMWQYSSSGKVDGISGKVDMDKCYIEYWKGETLANKILKACKTQAEWMQNYTYGWENNPTVAKSKKKGTCVTYVACVLQRLGYLASGKYIWHTPSGSVYGATDRMTVTYYEGKTIKAIKKKLKPGDVLMVGKKSVIEEGDGNGHILILADKWSGDDPYVWDNHSCERIRNGKQGTHTYSGSKAVVAVVRLK